MRRSMLPVGSLLLALITASAASPAGAESGPRPLSLGDLQGFGIRSGNPVEPQRPSPTMTEPAVEATLEPATAALPVVEPAPRPPPPPVVEEAAPAGPDEDVLPGIIIRARPAPLAAPTPPPAPEARPASIAALAPTPGEARAAAQPPAQTTALPQPRPAAHLPPQPRPAPAASAPAAIIVPAARPPLAERGPASLSADAMQAIALKPVAAVRVVPAAVPPATVEPAPAVDDVERRPATIVRVAPAPTTTPTATAAAALAEPAAPPATMPLQLDTDGLVAVGLRRSGGLAPAPATPVR